MASGTGAVIAGAAVSTWNPTTMQDCYNAINSYLAPAVWTATPTPQTIADKQIVKSNFVKFYDVVKATYGIHTIPKGTLFFHSDQYFSEHLNEFEPIGTRMKIQDIRTYAGGPASALPYSKVNKRVFGNFSIVPTIDITGNFTISTSVYVLEDDLKVLILPIDNRYTYIDPRTARSSQSIFVKSDFKIQGTDAMKEYLETLNTNPDGTKTESDIVAGFIAITNVDSSSFDDGETFKYAHAGSLNYYPEFILLDRFNIFKKVAAVDIIKPDMTLSWPLEPSLGPPSSISSSDKNFVRQLIKLYDKSGQLLNLNHKLPATVLAELKSAIDYTSLESSIPFDFTTTTPRKLSFLKYVSSKAVTTISSLADDI